MKIKKKEKENILKNESPEPRERLQWSRRHSKNEYNKENTVIQNKDVDLKNKTNKLENNQKINNENSENIRY